MHLGENLWMYWHDDPSDMILNPDGGFVMIDRIGIGGGDVSNFYGIGDCWMAKCDSLGNIEWEKTLGNDGLDNGINDDQQCRQHHDDRRSPVAWRPGGMLSRR
jgi:hypothetical protein